MSSKIIKQNLSTKGYPVKSVTYVRNEPTPSGYAKGYSIEFVDDKDSFTKIQDFVFNFHSSILLFTFMDFDKFEAAMNWIGTLPDLNQN